MKAALTTGLLAGGAEVHDIGLALSPMAYFAQFELKVEGVAMVTASHNDNGWTGIKMGMERPLTFAPEDMTALKEIVLKGGFDARNEAGRYIFVPDLPERYLADLLARPKLKRPLKAVVSCGNGTAGAFAPRVLAALGAMVIPREPESSNLMLLLDWRIAPALRMPHGKKQLSSCDRSTIRTWIRQGAKDN